MYIHFLSFYLIFVITAEIDLDSAASLVEYTEMGKARA